MRDVAPDAKRTILATMRTILGPSNAPSLETVSTGLRMAQPKRRNDLSSRQRIVSACIGIEKAPANTGIFEGAPNCPVSRQCVVGEVEVLSLRKTSHLPKGEGVTAPLV